MDANCDCLISVDVREPASTVPYAPPDCVPRRRPRAPGLSSRGLARTSAFIEAHLGESFTLSDLARAACISRFHFARLFRISMGASPMEYVRRVRIERARSALASGRHSISSAAAEFGFFDQSHFARAFRRATGLSPTEFLRACREHSNPVPAFGEAEA